MTSPGKRKVSVTLDADLVAAVEGDGNTTLSAEVNSALRAEFTRRQRQQALASPLDHLAEERGPLGTPEDEAEIARYMRLLGGMTATGTLAELYRGAGRNQALDALLARASGEGRGRADR